MLNKTKEKHRQSALKQFKDGMPEKTKEKIRNTVKKKYENSLYKKRITRKVKKALQRTEVKQKMCNAQKGNTNGFNTHNNKFFGDNNGRWNNGSSRRGYPEAWTDNLRKQIRKRDKFICQVCKENGWVVHHINYNKKDNNPKNLVALCQKCHAKTNGNRKYWTQYFQTKNKEALTINKNK